MPVRDRVQGGEQGEGGLGEANGVMGFLILVGFVTVVDLIAVEGWATKVSSVTKARKNAYC
jgi:hypothetical protein